jgi:signal transduction histidine kinase/CheY-like chemotaxis protein
VDNSEFADYKKLVDDQKEELIEILAALGLSEDFSLQINIPDENTPLAELYVAILVVAEHLSLTLTQRQESNELAIELEEKMRIIRSQKERLEELDRLKSDFLSTVSHELRTPMNAVLGFTGLLSSLITDPKQKEYLEAIRMGGQNLLNLINDILDLSKAEAGKMQIQLNPTDLRGLIEEIPTIFSLKLSQKHLTITTEIDPKLPSTILLDEVRMRQILFNLVGNAIKFTDKGYIKIIVKHEKVEKVGSEIDLYIAVEDSGIGIPKEEQNLIFEAFHQQKGQDQYKYGGSGLGLAITKKLVEAMKGNLSVKSNPNSQNGTLFEIQFTRVEVSTIETVRRDEEFDFACSMEFKPAKILIVDDVESNRNLIFGTFADSDIEILSAHNGQSALLMAREHQPDVILMDLKMPIMDGYEATRLLKKDESLKDIPVIALSAAISKSDKELREKHQFDGYLPKPISKGQLFKELSNFLSYSSADSSDNDTSNSNLGKGQQSISFYESMKSLPSEWKLEMKQAIERVDLDQIYLLIDQILDQDSALAAAIQERMDDFEYEYILSMLD